MSNAADLSLNPAATDEDPQRFFWYGVWVVLMGVSFLPLLGSPFRISGVEYGSGTWYTWLVVHEFAAFLYFGHTFFSNIWAMKLRLTEPEETGIRARAFLRILACSITGPTAFIIPVTGLIVIDGFGGLENAPWAWDAYFVFWIMLGISVIPDVVRYARNRNAGNVRHGMKSGGIRGMLALFLTLYIMVCMIAKVSLFAGPLQNLGAALFG
ncbi:MAG: hypothetical protein ACR2QB_02295 [Gammaproteobacteria bacterium]